MPVLPFLFDCSYKRQPKSIALFCVSHALIAFMLAIAIAVVTSSSNGGIRWMMMYLSWISMLPVAQKKLHPFFYVVSLLTIVSYAIGGIVGGVLPLAYLLHQPARQTSS